MVKCCVITGYGINADHELVTAFEETGARAVRVPITDLMETPEMLRDFHILAFPGGFSFGDHIGSGLVFAHLFKQHLKVELTAFLGAKKPIIGICNGFQVLAKMGVLPNLKGDWTPETTLIHNNTGVFENSWIEVEFNPASPCIWTRGLFTMDIPIRHGEGRFHTSDPAILETLETKNLVALRYRGRNPNGSQNGIAGITDPTGLILGLMPHPEGFLFPENHPRWNRNLPEEGEGLKIFRNGVAYAEENLL